MSSKLIDQLFGLAETFVPLLGGPAGAAAMAGAKKVVELIDAVGELVPAADATVLAVTRDELDALITQVNAHADRTIASLEG